MKNVILFIIDSLRPDRLGFSGHDPSPSPRIDRLLSSGLCLTNCFTVGCPTDFSYPGLATSTLPLDKGGYASGISSRDITLAEVFNSAGYKTGIFMHDFWPSNWGLRRGYNDVFLLCTIARFYEDAQATIDYYEDAFRTDKKSLEDCLNALEKYLYVFFAEFRSYCRYMMDWTENESKLISANIHQYDFCKIDELLQGAEREFQSTPKEYAERLLLNIEESDVLNAIRRMIEDRQTKASKTVADKELEEILSAVRASQRGSSESIPSLAIRGLRALTRKNVFKTVKKRLRRSWRERKGKVQFSSGRFPSGAYIVNNLLNWIDNLESRPFFAWVQIMDVHELNFWSADLPNSAASTLEEISKVKELYRQIKAKESAYVGNPIYDFAVRYSDLQAARLLDFLEHRKLLEDTVIVLTADHGHNSAGWPIRPKIHVAVDFYDELYHVPLAFVGKDIEQKKSDGLCSTLDIAPTLLDLLGLPVPSSFRGISVIGQGWHGRDFVQMEHQGRGLGELGAKSSKPTYVCIRNKTHKLVYETPPPAKSKEGFIKEIYDLTNDPQERTNLAKMGVFSEDLANLLCIAKERVEAIRNDKV